MLSGWPIRMGELMSDVDRRVVYAGIAFCLTTAIYFLIRLVQEPSSPLWFFSEAIVLFCLLMEADMLREDT